MEALRKEAARLLALPATKELEASLEHRDAIARLRLFAVPPPPLPTSFRMSEEEIAFADELAQAVQVRWSNETRGGLRAAQFILAHYGNRGQKAGSILENPLFRMLTLQRIDPKLYLAYASSLRPDRLRLHPDDDLQLRGQGSKPEHARYLSTESSKEAKSLWSLRNGGGNAEQRRKERSPGYNAEKQARYRARKKARAQGNEDLLPNT